MDSFEELGLRPELVEALVSEGIETPTALQAQAIPVLRRGNPAVLRAGPGGGTLVAYGAPLLEGLEPGGRTPRAVVLVPTRERASELASSLGRLGLYTGHRCAALGGPWALPGHADVLAATPADLEAAIRSAEVKVEGVGDLVLDGAGLLLETGPSAIDRILEFVSGAETRIVVVADPITPAVRSFAAEHVRRAVFLPADAAGEGEPEAPVQRGTLRVVAAPEGRGERPVVGAVAHALAADAHHALLYFRSEDRAADAADLLTIHGYAASSPGDPEAPVWLGLDPLEARSRIQESGIERDRIVVVSVDVPPETDTLDRRHGGAQTTGIAIAAPREIPHLRRIAREAGYRLEELVLSAPRGADEVDAFRDRVEHALATEDLGAYLTLIEPLLDRWSGAEVAAALAALLRQRKDRVGETAPSTAGAAAPVGRPPAWTRLFLSVGSRDGVGPGDLLGAITGEAGLEGSQVGRIDIKETFSRVEVQDKQADRVIGALNGITIRGRSVRADFDRGQQRAGGEGGGRGSEGSGRGEGGARGGRTRGRKDRP